jgi:hypothetical protein
MTQTTHDFVEWVNLTKNSPKYQSGHAMGGNGGL